MQTHFSVFDYLILLVYVIASLSAGLWFAKSQKSIAQYFLAGRSAPPWAVSISLVSSNISAISYIGIASLVFTGDLKLMPAFIAAPAAALFVSYYFVPFLAANKVYTIYEYLERRFNIYVRLVASTLFLFTRGSHLAVALYAAGLTLTQIMGTPIWISLVAIGGLTTLYTVLGGMKAVLWTDVIQFFVMMLGLLAVLIGVSIAFHWDIGKIWSIASHPPAIPTPWLQGRVDTTSHTTMFDFHWNLYAMTFWVVIINSFLANVGATGSDQVLVQRYLSTGSKEKMARSLIGAALISIPIDTIFFFTGVFLAAFYYHYLQSPGHAWVHDLNDPNRVMTHFISNGLPGTLGAIVIAGLFAGTMSSFSAGLNSLSTATYIDFVSRFRKTEQAESTRVAHAKWLTFFWGILLIGVAAAIGGDSSIMETAAKVMAPFAGPLLSVFLLGLLSRRANNFGVIAGSIVGAVATAYVTYFTSIHWLWNFVVGSVGGFLAGYLLSYLRPAQKSNIPS